MNERVRAVTGLGYTESQALFLELAALQSGYFLRRQFNDHLHRRCGALGQVFIERALEKGHIRCIETFGSKRLYHTTGHGLFTALGDENNRNRRSHQLATIRRRLMSLDYCVPLKDAQWLLTERDKTGFFKDRGLTEAEMPCEMFGGAKRFFVDRQPISIGSAGDPSIVFIDEGLKSLSQWELFLRGHRALIQRLERATILYAGPQPERFVPAERMFRRIVTGGTSSGSLDLGRLTRYFEARQQFEARQFASFDQVRLDQFREDRKVFVGERVETLYGGWCSSGDNALASISATGISFETHLLKHRYEWISPIYGDERRESDALDSIAGKTSA